MAAGKELAAAMMKDPDSARFRLVTVKKLDGARFVCGEINAKNSYGGYVGYQRFLSDGKLIVMDGIASPFSIELTIAGVPNARDEPNPAITDLCE
jgi:hypothetical protein